VPDLVPILLGSDPPCGRKEGSTCRFVVAQLGLGRGDPVDRVWKVRRDVAVEGPDRDGGLEGEAQGRFRRRGVTPSYLRLTEIQELLRQLRRVGK
jgi:hypothetical protein